MCSDQVQSDPTTKLDILKTHKEVQRESFTQISSFNTDSFSSAGGSDIAVNMRKYINIYKYDVLRHLWHFFRINYCSFMKRIHFI